MRRAGYDRLTLLAESVGDLEPFPMGPSRNLRAMVKPDVERRLPSTDPRAVYMRAWRKRRAAREKE